MTFDPRNKADRDRMRLIAEMATQDVHLIRHPVGPDGEPPGGMIVDKIDSGHVGDNWVARVFRTNDREFYAAVDPPTVTAMLDALDELYKVEDAAEQEES